MEQRMGFVVDALRWPRNLSAVCRTYGISRQTGYETLARYRAEGVLGLAPRSRAAHHRPQAMAPVVAEALLTLRRAHPRWGPRKLRSWLSARQPATPWPAPSSIGALTASTAPNDVWTIDFKGWFRTGDGRRCEPLTLVDDASRFLLRCVALAHATAAAVDPVVTHAFREYGLPRILRSDNGVPFATPRGLQGLSALAVRWLKLGIRLERLRPGHPEDNARHERLHRTLQEETAQPPATRRCTQQQAFDRFRALYNTERPHEALQQQPPATVYTPSPRPYPARILAPEYPVGVTVRRVRADGHIKWQGREVFLSQALRGEPVGLEAIAEGCWRVSFGPLALGCLHEDADPFQLAHV
jgi:putative transposase